MCVRYAVPVQPCMGMGNKAMHGMSNMVMGRAMHGKAVRDMIMATALATTPPVHVKSMSRKGVCGALQCPSDKSQHRDNLS